MKFKKIIAIVTGNQFFIQQTEYTTDRVAGKNGIYRVIWKCLFHGMTGDVCPKVPGLERL